MAMVEAVLLNPWSRRSGAKRRKGTVRKTAMAKRRSSARQRAYRALVKKLGSVKKAAAAWRRRKGGRKVSRRRRNLWAGQSAKHGIAARKGWFKRIHHRKGYAKRSGARFKRNPFSFGGRRGKFALIPSMNTMKAAAVRGAGAVGSEVVRASAYTLIGRDLASTSMVEDVVGKLVSGAVTGILVGYVAGQATANAVVEGAYTVAMYDLVADAVAMVSGGKDKVLGFIANPFAGRAVKNVLPGFSFGGALPASTAAAIEGLGAVVPEGQIVPLGAVMPEGQVLPLGEAPRFSRRF